MTTTTRPARRPPSPDGPAPTDRGPHTGPIRRIIVGSLATGLVGAAVLTLVAFSGAGEPIITGAGLLAFSLGWAMLAVLSTRMTDQPQRWAFIPAAGMAVTGIGLLILAPGDRALTAAGWVWPPLLLALAVWMGWRVHRDLAAGSGRWLLYPVVAIMAAAAVGGAVETVGLASDQGSLAMPGRLYDVGGHRLHLDCTGSGSPTVVLFNGLGEYAATWGRIAPAVAGTSRVCAYDRAGQGWSDDAASPQDGLAAAADLHTLLARAGENGPYVLVGHSIGGDYALTYAARYPEQVAGMVLLDTTPPYGVRATAGTSTPGPVALLPSLARLGIGRLLPASFWSSLPEPAAGQVVAFSTSPRGARNTAAESGTMPELLTQAQALSTVGNAPVVVVTAAEHVAVADWAAAHNRMAELSTNSSHRQADASHAGLMEDERGAATSAIAINDVVQAVRTGTLPTD
ncbi:alpha/beta hydrolase [Geodermatophilus sp. SYSU D00691]